MAAERASLRRVAAAVVTGADPTAALNLAAREVAALMRAEQGFVFRFTDGEVVIAGAHGIEAAPVGATHGMLPRRRDPPRVRHGRAGAGGGRAAPARPGELAAVLDQPRLPRRHRRARVRGRGAVGRARRRHHQGRAVPGGGRGAPGLLRGDRRRRDRQRRGQRPPRPARDERPADRPGEPPHLPLRARLRGRARPPPRPPPGAGRHRRGPLQGRERPPRAHGRRPGAGGGGAPAPGRGALGGHPRPGGGRGVRVDHPGRRHRRRARGGRAGPLRGGRRADAGRRGGDRLDRRRRARPRRQRGRPLPAGRRGALPGQARRPEPHARARRDAGRAAAGGGRLAHGGRHAGPAPGDGRPRPAGAGPLRAGRGGRRPHRDGDGLERGRGAAAWWTRPSSTTSAGPARGRPSPCWRRTSPPTPCRPSRRRGSAGTGSAGTAPAGRTALAGEDIPDGARILAVADRWDALTAPLPAGEGLPPEAALAAVRRDAGTCFCPDVVAALASLQAVPAAEGA